MPKILNLPEKKPVYPLIEIMGSVDIGKSLVAKYLALRINAEFKSFPILDPKSPTGRILLFGLTKNIQLLEKNPEWWMHIYAANLYEQGAYLREALKKGPVIVTNYMYSYKAWMGSCGINSREFGKSFTASLPVPNIAYSISTSEPLIEHTGLKIGFSEELKYNLKKNLSNPRNSKIVKVKVSEVSYSFPQVAVNKILISVSNDIKSRFKDVSLDEKILCTKKDF